MILVLRQQLYPNSNNQKSAILQLKIMSESFFMQLGYKQGKNQNDIYVTHFVKRMDICNFDAYQHQ